MGITTKLSSKRDSENGVVHSVCILSCSAHKRPVETWAENLYASESFFLARRYAEANFDSWLVLSAQCGLLKPSESVAPYDRHIAAVSSEEYRALAERLRSQIAIIDPNNQLKFTSVCVNEYNQLLEMAQIHPDISPISSLEGEERLARLRSITDPVGSEADLDQAYQIIERLIGKRGLIPFREAIQHEMPTAGIYLFFDRQEPRLKNIDHLRVIRVGTHGVASGSKATLRDRMRAHYGTSSGGGNHRSSIFRLHVGRSMILAGRSKAVKTWGSVELPKSHTLRRQEAKLESNVSEYIGNLLVATIDVPGDSSKENDRAYLEQNLIALISNTYRPLDPPSHRWLGRFSEKAEIRRSGIWNVNHTAQTYDPKFLAMLEYYVSVTLGETTGTKPIAPLDWIASARRDTRQLNLFSDDGT